MSFAGVVRRIHLWVGLILGVQVAIWMLSGVIMTWFHIDLVRGERAMFSAPPPELEAKSYASPGGVIAQMDGAVSVELRHFMGRPVYDVAGVDGRALFDASTGQKITPLDEKTARSIARGDYVGDGKIERIALMADTPHEYRGVRPVWRADFNDKLNTRLYISPDTGKVVSRRNDVWRLYDFFWMLHIMDYGARTNFNNLLVQTTSGAGFIFALSGLFMLVMKSGRQQIARDVRALTGRRQQRK